VLFVVVLNDLTMIGRGRHVGIDVERDWEGVVTMKVRRRMQKK